MPLVKLSGITPDPFTRLDATAPLTDGPVLVPLARFLAERDSLVGRNAPLGVLVANTDDVAALAKLEILKWKFSSKFEHFSTKGSCSWSQT